MKALNQVWPTINTEDTYGSLLGKVKRLEADNKELKVLIEELCKMACDQREVDYLREVTL